jgi:hypothetical protein
MASEINEIYSKISEFLSRGPALTIDIAGYIRKDTTQTSAILDYYVSRGSLNRIERRYGTSAIYYFKEDREKALDKLFQTLNSNEKNLINRVKSAKVIKSEDLSPTERYLSKSLTDFIKSVSAKDSETEEKIDYLYYSELTLDEVKAAINPPTAQRLPVAREKNTKQRETQQSRVAKKAGTIDSSSPETKNMLLSYGFSDASMIEKDIYLCDYGPSRLKVIVIFSNKNSLTDKDFIKFAGYAESYKTVSFVITASQKIGDYSKYGNVINIIKIN